MSKTAIVFLFITLLLLSENLLAQEKPFVRFDEDAGLANNKVKSILKDNEGFLWLGTDNGLSKYDGQRFVNFRKGEGLPGNRIWALAKDAENRIYIGCYRDGLAVLEKNKVTAVYYLPSKYPNSIRRLHYSEQYKILVVGTDYGIYLFKDNTFYEIPYPKHPINKASIISILEYRQDLYFTSHTPGGKLGILKLIINKENLSRSVAQCIDYKIGMRFSLAVLNDTLYSNHYSKIFAYPLADVFNKQTIITDNEQFMPWVSCPVSKNEILMGGYGEGVFVSDLKIYNTVTKELKRAPYQINPGSINDLLVDAQSDIIWVCSDNGLFALLNKHFEIQELTGADGVVNIAQLNNVICILSKSGLFTLQNENITLKFSSSKLAEMVFESRNKYYSKMNSNDLKVFNSWPFLLSDFAYNNNKLFLITTKGAFSLTDLSTYLPFDSRNFITDTKGGAYYIADYSKLSYFPEISKTMEHITVTGDMGTVSDIVKTIRVGDVYYFCSFYNGIYAIKGDKVYYLNESNSILDNNLTGIDTTRSGEVWCTSSYGNLYNIGFDSKLTVKRKLNQQNSGIVGENYKWLKFNDHNLYLGSNKGLSIIPVSQLKNRSIDSVQFFNAANGFEFISAGNPISDSDGNIYIHTSEKLIKIDNAAFRPTISKLVLQNILLNNKPATLAMLSDKTLSYSTTGISLEFSILRFPSSRNISYRYRVNNGNWNDGGKIMLQSLKSGKYVIDFEAKDIENNKLYHRLIKFNIALPYWQQWWFVAISVITIALILFFFTRWRITLGRAQQEEKNKLLRKNSDLQMQSLQVQMNPHFIFNSLNSIQNFILSSNMNEAVRYLGYLGSIIRMNLENVTEEYIHLGDEVKFLLKYIEIEKMRFKENLDIRLTNSINDQSIMIPPMLVQPIIENAIKHGVRNQSHAGLIQVKFAIENEMMCISIEDNGIGRGKAKSFTDENHKSIGLALTKQRLSLLNEKNKTTDFKLDIIDLHSNNLPTGTKVIITLQIFRAT